VVGTVGLLGCLGTWIPFAMAAKLAHPDKKVILLNGDGSFGFNADGVRPMLRHNIPVICVITRLRLGPWSSTGRAAIVARTGSGARSLILGVTIKWWRTRGHGEFVTKTRDIPAIKRALESEAACVNVMTIRP